jgi:hypothetical protein
MRLCIVKGRYCGVTGLGRVTQHSYQSILDQSRRVLCPLENSWTGMSRHMILLGNPCRVSNQLRLEPAGHARGPIANLIEKGDLELPSLWRWLFLDLYFLFSGNQ